MNDEELVRALRFGSRTAEEESDFLADYFVRTEAWRQVESDEVDVVYAPKGGGKSAIYSMLMGQKEQLSEQGIVALAGENPSGNSAFKSVLQAPDTSEAEFIGVWKLYFSSLILSDLREKGFDSPTIDNLERTLSRAGVELKGGVRKRNLFASILSVFRQARTTPEAVELEFATDPVSGLPVVTPRIKLAPISGGAAESIDVDDLVDDLSDVVQEVGLKYWIILDRLDVAFASSPDLEAVALRALFRTYADMISVSEIRLKIFLRSDIWADITAGGFREASHIERSVFIEWNSKSLLQLVVRRLLNSTALVEDLDLDIESVLDSFKEQEKLLYRLVPPQIDSGANRPRTWEWVLSRTADGSSQTAPRELIHLFSEAKNEQIKLFETGAASKVHTRPLESQAFKAALPTVSRVRLTQTLYAEYPDAKSWIEMLRDRKAEHTVETFSRIWNVDASQGAEIVARLLSIGFLEKRLRDNRGEDTYRVPFLYRQALNLIQGLALDA